MGVSMCTLYLANVAACNMLKSCLKYELCPEILLFAVFQVLLKYQSGYAINLGQNCKYACRIRTHEHKLVSLT